MTKTAAPCIHPLGFLGKARVTLFVFVMLSLGACTTTSPLTREAFTPTATESVRVLIMEPDVELSELTLGGLSEPKADWSELGLDNTRTALNAWLVENAMTGIAYDDSAIATERRVEHLQLQKLHGAVGRTILRHGYGLSAMELPQKEDAFDWTLGSSATVLKEDFGADYALFVYLRDSFASDGRIAMGIALMALGAIVNPGGAQVGFASLVDLNTGNVVWFNRLFSQFGDLRKADAAEASIRALLKDNPL